MKYAIIILYQTSPHWLGLSRKERSSFFKEKVFTIIKKYEQRLTLRLFDSEAFHANVSDFLLLECSDLSDYYAFMEQLRDTELFTIPYLHLKEIVMGIENGFQWFEEKILN